jgi:hypothetical protein
LTVFQPVDDVVDPLLEMRKREILCPDLSDVLEVFPGDIRQRSLEIGEVFFGETNDPAIGVGEFVASPYIRSRYPLGEDLGHRTHPFAMRPAPVPHCIVPVTMTLSRRIGARWGVLGRSARERGQQLMIKGIFVIKGIYSI